MKILQTFGIAATPTQTTATFATPAQRVTVLNTANQAFLRTIILTNDGIKVSRGTTSAGIAMADLLLAVITLESGLTWVPIIGTQPSDASCVHSSTAAVFTVVATSETGITKTYQWQYNAKAVGTLTSDNTAPSDGDTVTVGGVTYTFKTTLTPTAGQVLIGANADAALLNLIRAINHSGTAGTDYANLGTTAVVNPQVTAATSVTSHAFAVTAITAGTDGNAIASTETSSHLSWGAATLASGGWTNASGTVNGCVYTNGTTASLTCTPTTTGQTGFSHRVQITDVAGTTTSDSVTLTIT